MKLSVWVGYSSQGKWDHHQNSQQVRIVRRDFSENKVWKRESTSHILRMADKQWLESEENRPARFEKWLGTRLLRIFNTLVKSLDFP